MDLRPKNSYSYNSYLYWKGQIDNANKWREKFVKTGKNIFNRYRCDGDYKSFKRRYNILYSNTETILPVIYSDKPIPDVRARDLKVISDRKAAEMIEKGLGYFIDCQPFNTLARQSANDFLLAGLGQVRVRYEADITKENQEIGIHEVTEDMKVTESEGKFYTEVEKVAYEKLIFEYVHWEDFIFPNNRGWSSLPWLAFRSYVTYDEAVELFGVEKATMLNYEVQESPDANYSKVSDAQYQEKKAQVYEIWDKINKQQIFYCETNNNSLLLIEDDPLELENFFPCPKPLLSIETSDTLLPVPFYKQYEDQAKELDDITDRIEKMIENMRRRGVYDGSQEELVNLPRLGDNQFIPISNWTRFSERGGLNGAVQVEDIQSYAAILDLLFQKRQALIEDIYQIIGISDIRRGATDPRETLGAQKMKGKYGTIRISTYQRKMSEFLRDLLRLGGQLIISQFEPETISVITGMPLDTKIEDDGQGGRKVIEVGVKDLLESLKNQEPKGVVIDIETDTSILEDGDDKEDMLTMVQTLTGFTQAAPALSQTIGIDATSSILLGIVQRYKMGRNVQMSIQDYIDNLKKNPPQQQNEPSDAQIKIAMQERELAFKERELQVNSQIKVAELGIAQQDNKLKAIELEQDNAIEQDYVNLEAISKMLEKEKLEAEAKNPKDNAIVGA